MTTDLIARLEAAPEGSRELSDEVLLALRWKRTEDSRSIMRPMLVWIGPGECRHPDGQQPDPTRSLDDAMALVPEGWDGMGHICWPGYDEGVLQGTALAELHHKFSSGGNLVHGVAATPALALTIACLKAVSECNPGRRVVD